MNKPFEGRIALVTGGASGIGEACARELAAGGARVVIADITEDLAESVASSLDGGAFARVDVMNDADVEALAARVSSDIGPVDVLVTSAGVLQRPLPPEQFGMDAWDRVLDINLRGLYLTCVAFGGRMARRGRGTIVNIASIAGMISSPLHAYGPGKAAVISLTQTLAAEWGRSGVRVNAVAPGFVMTPALKAQVAAGERNVDAMNAQSALPHLVDAVDVAKAAAFLASDDARSITGITLPVDSGALVALPWNIYGGLGSLRPSKSNLR